MRIIISILDEGVEQVLDIMQKRGAINTLFLTTFTHGRGLGGRQIPGENFRITGRRSRMRKRITEVILQPHIRSFIKIQFLKK